MNDVTTRSADHDPAEDPGRQRLLFETADLVRKLPLFSHLDLDMATHVARHATKRAYSRGHVILEQGHVGGDLCILLSGRSEKLRTHSDGREIVTDVVLPGEQFGEHSILDDGPQSTTVRCSLRCEVLHVERAVLASLLPDDQVLTLKLLRTLCAQVRESNGLIRTLMLPTTRARACERLRWLEQRERSANAGAFRRTHTELARFIGARRETVGKAVADLLVESRKRDQGR